MHGKDTKLLISDQDMTAVFRDSDLGQATTQHDNTPYGKEDHTFEAGLGGDGTVKHGGFFNATKHAQLKTYIGSANGEPHTLGMGGLTLGNVVFTTLQKASEYGVSAPAADLVTTVFTITPDGGIDSGISLHDLTAETVTGNGASYDGGATGWFAASTNGGVAVVHCTAFTGTSIDVKVQDSPDNSVWTDLATFTQLTAIGAQHLVVAEGTTVDRYLRATWTIVGTSITFHVSFSRR